MPRVGSFRQINRASLTPFAQLVYDYLLSFQPTKLVSELALESGISNNAIWSWLRHGILPRRATVVQLAERVPDLATLDELLAAAGLPSTATVQRERQAHAAMLRESLRELLALVDTDPAFGPEERALIHRAMARKVEEFVAQTDTWREYGHASPALHEAQRAEEQAHLSHTPLPTRAVDGDEAADDHPSGPYRHVTGA